MSAGFGPAEDLKFNVHFLDEGDIQETLQLVSSGWQMGVDFWVDVYRQHHSHLETPPQFRVLRDDFSWGDWHPLAHPHGHPIRAQGRALQWQGGAPRGETVASVTVSTFEEHPQPH
jgi:hypothetical protein